jgi:hypothetical protein
MIVCQVGQHRQSPEPYPVYFHGFESYCRTLDTRFFNFIQSFRPDNSKIPGNLLANIVFPKPGGPIIKQVGNV